MENQKIINLLNKSNTNSKHFATKKWFPETFKILGWCPAGSVLPHGEKVPL